MSAPNWYHVFCTTNEEWLDADRRQWTPHYSDAAEFPTYKLAFVAGSAAQRKHPAFDVIILGDCGVIDDGEESS